jgi:hypothetical protein
MTGVAIRRQTYVLIIHVTLHARHIDVHAGKRIGGVRVVIKFRIQPGGRGVAEAAIMGHAGLHVGRIFRIGKVGLVTCETCGRRALVPVVDVAGGAFERGVHAGKRIPGEFEVIEARSEPIIHGVATFTRSRESRGDVVNHRCLVILLMARIAGRRESHKLSCGCAFVARFALQHGVRADKGKTILMILDFANRHLPAFDGMTPLAVGSELTPVDVRVTIGAMRARIFENQRGVALGAADVFMHAAQRVARVVVAEFRKRADRLPTGEAMAVLA